MDKTTKTLLGVASLVISIFMGMNAMIDNDNSGTSWWGWAAAFLVLALGLGLWIINDQRRAQRSAQAEAERAIKEAQRKMEDAQRLAEASQAQAEAEAKAQAEAEAKAQAEAEAAKAQADAKPAPQPIDPAKAEALASEKALVDSLADGAPTLSGTPDDLMLIEGIGPHYRDILAAAGVDTFAKVAALDEAKFIEIAKAAGSRKHGSMATWARQAALAAAGDWPALRTLQDQLVGGQVRKG